MSNSLVKTHIPPGLQPAIIRPDKETFLLAVDRVAAMHRLRGMYA